MPFLFRFGLYTIQPFEPFALLITQHALKKPSEENVQLAW